MSKKQKKMLIRILISAALLIGFNFLPFGGPLRFVLYLIPYLVIGYDILIKAFKGIKNHQPFDESLLMAIATIGAIAIAIYTEVAEHEAGDYVEAIAVMLFYQIGEWFQSYAVGKSRRNISELMDIRPDYANVERDGQLTQVDPEEVAVGDTITVKAGERVPLDGVVLEGNSAVNESALTGESIPVDKAEGDLVSAATVNQSGFIRCEATRVGEDTTLYAVYASGECQVTYRVNGVTTTEEVTLGETPKEVPALPEGYMGWVSGSGAVVDPASTQIWGDQTFTAYEAITLNTWDHSKYMDGSSDGLFHPGQYMTRAEVAQVLYGLLAEEPEARVSFTDVSDDMWYAEAVESLGAMGILDCEAGSAFRPNAAISRGEFALMLSHFISGTGDLESFVDVPTGNRFYEAIGATAAEGLFSGYADGTFHPDAALTRAQAERALYEKFRRGEALTRQEAESLLPTREEFVVLWRYLKGHANQAPLDATAPRLARSIARSAGRRETVMRTLVCLEVFDERGLIRMERTTDHLHIALRPVEGKVDLDDSSILRALRRIIHSNE